MLKTPANKSQTLPHVSIPSNVEPLRSDTVTKRHLLILFAVMTNEDNTKKEELRRDSLYPIITEVAGKKYPPFDIHSFTEELVQKKYLTCSSCNTFLIATRTAQEFINSLPEAVTEKVINLFVRQHLNS